MLLVHKSSQVQRLCSTLWKWQGGRTKGSGEQDLPHAHPRHLGQGNCHPPKAAGSRVSRVGKHQPTDLELGPDSEAQAEQRVLWLAPGRGLCRPGSPSQTVHGLAVSHSCKSNQWLCPVPQGIAHGRSASPFLPSQNCRKQPGSRPGCA